ncbi:BRCT domain-containing protein [Aliarcobacter butzleri]|uniref:BRCT domain-containing protein n=1 Tax=Aliarcobacter butzleri TaxID=28197 RepID=UPI001EDA724C|nr:BRCT domain-containing protein [Aliarcobacter butzleri]MCG3706408.1 BRCT domain-containing protein [Aliarcobacter butzleri]
MEHKIRYREKEAKDRNIDELIGISRGIIADGIINTKEGNFLLDWIKKHFDVYDLNTYPVNTIYDRLSRILEDGFINDEESKEFSELLASFTGDKPIHEEVSSMSSTLPLTNPAPNIEFINKTFCMTGAFTIGTRAKIEELIQDLGGVPQKNPTLKTNYLVIGILGSGDWIHSSYGRKIEKAVELRDINGSDIQIISEEHFIKFI